MEIGSKFLAAILVWPSFPLLHTPQEIPTNLSLRNSCLLLKASTGFKFPESGALLPSDVLKAPVIHFLTRPQSNASHEELLGRSWHKGGHGDTRPLQEVTEPQTFLQAPRQAPGQRCHRGRISLRRIQFVLSQTPLHSKASGLISVPVLMSSSVPLISRAPSH